MQRRRAIQTRSRERGQTLLLFAVSVVVLIGMAALAIDATTLYVARGETQRAADATALAGAKAFVDSGVTTATNSADEPALQTLAGTMATGYINTALAQNKVGGVAASLVGAPTPVYPAPGNPQITVTLQRTNLPIFFARIFGQTLATVTASATAEAYNSSNPGTAGANSMPPVAPSCVKPWLVPNMDPQRPGNPPFVNLDGSIKNPGIWGSAAKGVIGEPLGTGPPGNVVLENIFRPAGLGVVALLPGTLTAPGYLGYLPAAVSSFSGPCSACAGGSDLEESISCCNTAQVYACGGTGANVLVDLATNGITDIVSGTACLIGASGGGVELGRDTIDFGNYPPGGGGSIEIRAGGGPHNGSFVTTSNQIVTMPIISTDRTLLGAGQVTVIGFMQVFVVLIDSGDGGIQAYILNISGCGTNINTAATAISGGGVSAVPVRLIHN